MYAGTNPGNRLAKAVAVDEIPTTRPVMTLDVDGVLNAYDHGREPSMWQPEVEDSPEPYDIDCDGTICLPYKPTGAYGHVKRREYRILWSTDMVRDIARAADEGKVTLLWLTSWNDEAGLLADEMLWPGRPSPVLGYVDAKGEAEHCTYDSKRVAMRAICDAMEAARPDDPMPVVAFDDDMPWDNLAWGSGVEFPTFFHGIATDPRYGITKSQWRKALALVDAATRKVGETAEGAGDEVGGHANSISATSE